ncbi:chloramphenicol phosphotransferase CPT family protein [Thalassiella azotivora]
MTRDRGRVVVLNGTSSAGKSTLLRAVQDAEDAPWLDLGLDRFLGTLPRRYLGPRWPEVQRYRHGPDGAISAVEPGPAGDLLTRAMHRAVAAAARSGADVVVDHVLLSPAWARDLVAALDGLPVLWVRVGCPPDVLVRREAERGERTLGQAAAQLPVVHAALAAADRDYDLEVDTSTTSPQEGAAAVLAAASTLAGRPLPNPLDPHPT